MQSARRPLGRVARGALFAASAVALTECSSSPSPQPMYGSACMYNPDACVVTVPDASTDASDASAKDANETDASADAPDAD